MAKRKPTSRPRAHRPQGSPGPSPARPPRPGRGEPPGGRARALAAVRRFSFLIVLLVAVGGGVALGISQGRKERDRGFGSTATTQESTGTFTSAQDEVAGKGPRETFAHTCGTCHTLRAAGVSGGIGPDLDRVVLTSRRVREMIRNGSLDSAMPANLLRGRQADEVARYVARVSRASVRARENR